MRCAIALLTMVCVACGGPGSGSQQAPPAAAPPQSQAVATPAPAIGAVTPAGRADSAPPRADSGQRPGAPAKDAKDAKAKEEPLRDSVAPPKFTIDEKGRVTPVKKP